MFPPFGERKCIMGALYKSPEEAVTQDAAQILPDQSWPGKAGLSDMEEHHRFVLYKHLLCPTFSKLR